MKLRLFTVAALVALFVMAPSAGAQDASVAGALQPFVDGHVLAGAVSLVASRDKVLDVQTVGYSDVQTKTPMRADDVFWIASMSKAMTAAAVMMLVDADKISLDDPVAKYLPTFAGAMYVAEKSGDQVTLKKPSHPITIRQALSHTAGMQFWSAAEYKRKIDQYPLAISVLTDALTPLNDDPGSKFQYCNAGINTAGRIVEVVGGMPFEQFLQQRLFDPLGMVDTTFWPTAEQLKRLAKSYKPTAAGDGLVEIPIEQLTYPLSDRSRGACPAGGLFSTAHDVALFCRMLLSGGEFGGRRYLSRASVRMMTSTQTGQLLNGGKSENGYGLGLFTTRYAPSGGETDDAGPASPGPFDHAGAYATHMWVDPQRDRVTVFMVQHAGFGGEPGRRVMATYLDAVNRQFRVK